MKEVQKMKKVKINYHAQYDNTNQICGYVVSENKGKYYLVSRKAYNRELKEQNNRRPRRYYF